MMPISAAWKPIPGAVRCMSVGCFDQVVDPEQALGWYFLPVSGGSEWWFCPSCSAARMGTA